MWRPAADIGQGVLLYAPICKISAFSQLIIILSPLAYSSFFFHSSHPFASNCLIITFGRLHSVESTSLLNFFTNTGCTSFALNFLYFNLYRSLHSVSFTYFFINIFILRAPILSALFYSADYAHQRSVFILFLNAQAVGRSLWLLGSLRLAPPFTFLFIVIE